MAENLQEWYNGFRKAAKASGDTARLGLIELYDQATRSFESDPDLALHVLAQGRALAEQLNEPCWTLYYDFWRTSVYLFQKKEFKVALDNAVRTVVEARKPQYEHCPIRTRVHSILIDVYARLDPIGYAPQIRDTIAYMQAEMPLDEEMTSLLQSRLVYLDFVFDRLDSAMDGALRYLSLANNNVQWLSNAYQQLCEVCYRRYDHENALKYAQAGEICARGTSGKQRALVSFLAWQTLFARLAGNETEARRLLNVTMQQAVQVGAKLYDSYYDALCEYYEYGGQYENSMRLRDAQLEDTVQSGSVYDECKWHIRRLRLLKKMGQPLDSELTASRESATKLMDSSLFLGKLDRVLQGDLSDRW
ncbi:MAG: hypothetical protein ABI947_26940 [Chloroflexota bacterium]